MWTVLLTMATGVAATPDLDDLGERCQANDVSACDALLTWHMGRLDEGAPVWFQRSMWFLAVQTAVLVDRGAGIETERGCAPVPACLDIRPHRGPRLRRDDPVDPPEDTSVVRPRIEAEPVSVPGRLPPPPPPPDTGMTTETGRIEVVLAARRGPSEVEGRTRLVQVTRAGAPVPGALVIYSAQRVKYGTHASSVRLTAGDDGFVEVPYPGSVVAIAEDLRSVPIEVPPIPDESVALPLAVPRDRCQPATQGGRPVGEAVWCDEIVDHMAPEALRTAVLVRTGDATFALQVPNTVRITGLDDVPWPIRLVDAEGTHHLPEDGALRGLPAGDYTVLAVEQHMLSDGGVPGRLGVGEVRLLDGEPTARAEMRVIDRPTARVPIVDEVGRPVPFALVDAWDPFAEEARVTVGTAGGSVVLPADLDGNVVAAPHSGSLRPHLNLAPAPPATLTVDGAAPWKRKKSRNRSWDLAPGPWRSPTGQRVDFDEVVIERGRWRVLRTLREEYLLFVMVGPDRAFVPTEGTYERL